MTLSDLTEIIRDYEGDLAPGSETMLWGEYLTNIRQNGHDPLSGDDVKVAASVVAYWLGAYYALTIHDSSPDVFEPWTSQSEIPDGDDDLLLSSFGLYDGEAYGDGYNYVYNRINS